MIQRWLKGLCCIALYALTGWANAQEWPAKSVRIVVPFPAGGATDAPARILGEKLSRSWRQAVVVENRPGAGGSVAAAEVARTVPDGYTLLFPSGSVMTVNQFVYSKLGYDPERDFVPVSIVVSSPLVLVVPEKSPYVTMESLIDVLRRPEAKLNFAHAGVGSQSHLANEYFLQQAQGRATGVPYKGDPPAIADLIGGSIDYAVMSITPSLAHIRSGKLMALGVTSKSAVPLLPGVRPIASVLPDFDNSGWFGLVAPAAVPDNIVSKIARDVRMALEDPEIRSKLEGLGFRIVASTPQEMAEAMAMQRVRWQKVVRERNIRQE